MAGHSLRTMQAVRIDPICQQFEEAWQRGDRPKIEDFVEQADVDDRESLRSELRRIESEYRRKHGEQPTVVPSSDVVPVTTDRDMAVEWNPFRIPHDSIGMDSAPPPPTRLGRYQITGTLGQGAFGVVYRGHDPDLERDVAIKVPHRRRVASASADEAYLAEARTLAKLDHSGIVPVLDVGRSDDGLCYVVSKLMCKGDLAALLKAARPPHDVAARLVAQIGDALHHAHQRGLVHRDIKPGNILLDEAGLPLVADFGLALADESYGSGSNCCGTPGYMSPEQARGEGHRVDARSDIYSLGVMFYELLTGRRPYRSVEIPKLLDEVATGEIRPPRQLDQTIPKELERICLTALAKRTEDRYTTAFDLAEDLRQWGEGSGDREQGIGDRDQRTRDRDQGIGDSGAATGNREQPEPLVSVASRLPACGWLAAGVGLVIAAGLIGRELTLNRNPSADATSAGSTEPERSAAAPAAIAKQPLRVTAIDVAHFRRTPAGDVAEGEIVQSRCRMKLGDKFQVTAHLSRPAYAYIIAFRPDGQLDVCYPADEDTPPPLTDEPRYPLSGQREAYGVDEGTGLWVLAVLASETPLPSYGQWLHQAGAEWPLKWAPRQGEPPTPNGGVSSRDEPQPTAVVWCDGDVTEYLARSNQRVSRGKGKLIVGPAGIVPEIVDVLKTRGGGDTAAAKGFLVESAEH